MKNKLTFALGLAKKAGALTAGSGNVLDGIRHKKVKLVLIASDVSGESEKKLRTCSDYYKVRCEKVSLTMSELSNAIGLIRQTASVGILNHEILNLVNIALNEIIGEGI